MIGPTDARGHVASDNGYSGTARYRFEFPAHRHRARKSRIIRLKFKRLDNALSGDEIDESPVDDVGIFDDLPAADSNVRVIRKRPPARGSKTSMSPVAPCGSSHLDTASRFRKAS